MGWDDIGFENFVGHEPELCRRTVVFDERGAMRQLQVAKIIRHRTAHPTKIDAKIDAKSHFLMQNVKGMTCGVQTGPGPKIENMQAQTKNI